MSAASILFGSVQTFPGLENWFTEVNAELVGSRQVLQVKTPAVNQRPSDFT